MKRKNKDYENEGIGITTVVIAVFLSGLALYFFSSYHQQNFDSQNKTDHPFEVVIPVNSNDSHEHAP